MIMTRRISSLLAIGAATAYASLADER